MLFALGQGSAGCLQPRLSPGLSAATFVDLCLNGTLRPSEATIAYVQDSLEAQLPGEEHEDVYRNELARSGGDDLCNPTPWSPKEKS